MAFWCTGDSDRRVLWAYHGLHALYSTYVCREPFVFLGTKGTTDLNRELVERKLAQEELEKYRQHLEDMVKERTAELTLSNQQLQLEVDTHGLTPVALKS
jgi:C4-dicarboxylate-specific signal transduction histidine kinase